MLPTRRQALGALGSGLFASTACGQKNPPDTVAGIPVNYDEALVGTYMLPDPLTFNDGKRVDDAKMWREKRRRKLCACSRKISLAAARAVHAD